MPILAVKFTRKLRRTFERYDLLTDEYLYETAVLHPGVPYGVDGDDIFNEAAGTSLEVLGFGRTTVPADAWVALPEGRSGAGTLVEYRDPETRRIVRVPEAELRGLATKVGQVYVDHAVAGPRAAEVERLRRLADLLLPGDEA